MNKDAVIRCRVTELEKVVFHNIAEHYNMTLSELVLKGLHGLEREYYRECQRQEGECGNNE